MAPVHLTGGVCTSPAGEAAAAREEAAAAYTPHKSNTRAAAVKVPHPRKTLQRVPNGQHKYTRAAAVKATHPRKTLQR
eukprot:7324478-Pyramimonas_sp.AAC.1